MVAPRSQRHAALIPSCEVTMPLSAHFSVSIPSPHDHLIHVSLELSGLDPALPSLDLAMPVWTPGSYMVREYSRHVQSLHASSPSLNALPVAKQDKATWRIDPLGATSITVRYALYAHELAVRTNHVDATHAFFNGPALYLHPQGIDCATPTVSFHDLPDGWRVFGGLDPVPGQHGVWSAPSLDAFIDCPVEIGPHTPISFEVLGVPHHVVVWGHGNHDADRLRADLTRIVLANASFFGDALPYEHYTFIIHLTAAGRGGLEHLNSTVLLCQRHDFCAGPQGTSMDADGQPDDKYIEFLRLAAHEHFHAWNVKRIRPARLGPFDYQQENYTRDLWTVEGVTSYYELISLRRAGLLTAKRFLAIMADSVKALDSIPGRRLHSLEDSSFDAWIKLYRPDEHTRNSSISYYLKGELVCFLLDAHLRAATQNTRSLDDVMALLWRRFEETGEGYAEGSYGQWVKEATGVDADALIDALTRTTDEIDWARWLAPVGLALSTSYKAGAPGAWLGVNTRADGDRVTVASVLTGSPGLAAGVYPGDELVACNGFKLSATRGIDEHTRRARPGDQATLHMFRREELVSAQVTLGAAPPDTYAIGAAPDASPEAAATRTAWLGAVEVAS
jgi:predicted metalloprotease with PDZ domain